MFNYKASGTVLAAKKAGIGYIVMIALEHCIGDHAVVFYCEGEQEWRFAYSYCSDYSSAEQVFETKCKESQIFGA